jgi:hypothetical protein
MVLVDTDRRCDALKASRAWRMLGREVIEGLREIFAPNENREPGVWCGLSAK